MDSTVMHINKGNALSWGNPKGTHTERKGNAVMRIKNNIIYYCTASQQGLKRSAILISIFIVIFW